MDSIMDYVIEQLKRLIAIPSPSGFTRVAAGYVVDELRQMGFKPEMTRKSGVLVELGGSGEPLALLAHLDTLGAMVAEVKANGRLRVAPVGGLMQPSVDSENCTVHTRDGRVYEATFQMNNPSGHVNPMLREEKRDCDTMEIVVDEPIFSKADAEALGIANGDYISFDPRLRLTGSGYIKSRYLDDKLLVAILLGLAKSVASGKISLKRKVYGYFSVFEEVGHGCSASIPEDCVDMISLDMGCVGIGLACTEHQVSICAKDKSGPSNYELTGELIECARSAGVDYAVDIYLNYNSDADAALHAGYDLRHCVLGPGVYASHGYERSHMDGVYNTLKLLKHYLS